MTGVFQSYRPYSRVQAADARMVRTAQAAPSNPKIAKISEDGSGTAPPEIVIVPVSSVSIETLL
jgi:hypothetical protein